MKSQDSIHEDRLVLITNDERRMIVRALGLLATALNVEDGVCSDAYKNSVKELSYIFCEENWMSQYRPNSYKVNNIRG